MADKIKQAAEAQYPYLGNDNDSVGIREFNQKQFDRRAAFIKGRKFEQQYASQLQAEQGLYTESDMMDIAGWMAAADNKRPIPELKEEAENYIKILKAKKPAIPRAEQSGGVKEKQLFDLIQDKINHNHELAKKGQWVNDALFFDLLETMFNNLQSGKDPTPKEQSSEGVQTLHIREIVEENFKGLQDAMGGDQDLSDWYKQLIINCMTEISTPSNNQGVQWVKASERMPDSWHLKCVRFIHTKIPIHDIETLISDRPNSTPHIIEWLDESTPLTKGGQTEAPTPNYPKGGLNYGAPEYI